MVRMKDKDRPWLAKYDRHVPAHLDYPNVTINDLLAQAIERYPETPLSIFAAWT